MNQQTFTATTLQEAMLRAKSVLGPDALIVNIREVRTPNGAVSHEVSARSGPRPRTAAENVFSVHEAIGELRSLKTSWENTIASNERLRRQLENLVSEIRQPRMLEPQDTPIAHALRGVEHEIARTIMSRVRGRASESSQPTLGGVDPVIAEIAR